MDPSPIPPTVTPGAPQSGGPTTDDERTTAAMAHALTLLSFLIPLSGLLVPLVIYLTRKDAGAGFVTTHAKESLNFQITVYLALVVFGIASIVLIGIPFACATGVAGVVLPILAAIKAKDGLPYRYPYTLRLVK